MFFSIVYAIRLRLIFQFFRSQGDGGSPLVCPLQNDPTRFVQAGIVAWGLGCGENGTPGVYASIANGRQWIDEQMAFNNLDNSVYQYPN